MKQRPHSNLTSSDPTWLRTVAVGLGWIVTAVVLHLILAVVTNPVGSRPVSWLFGFHVPWFLPLPGLLVCLAGLVGIWKVAAPEPGGMEAGNAHSARRLARALAITALLWIVVFVPLRSVVALPVNEFFVRELGVLVAILATLALAGYLRRLALRIPPELALKIPGRVLALNTRVFRWVATILLLVFLVPAMRPFRLADGRWLWCGEWLGDVSPDLDKAILPWVGVALALWVLEQAVRYRGALRDTAASREAREGTPYKPVEVPLSRGEIRSVARLTCAWLVVLSGVAYFCSSRLITVVHVADPRIEQTLRLLLKKPGGSLTARDLTGLEFPRDSEERMHLELSLVQSPGEDSLDLSGLEHCRNLQRLSIGRRDRNLVCDLSPLGGLPRLEGLGLCRTQSLTGLDQCRNLRSLGILSVDGKLGGVEQCRNLRRLYLEGTVGDLRPLGELVNLKVLRLGKVSGYRGSIGDLRLLANLVNLEELRLDLRPPLSYPAGPAKPIDLSPLGELTHLRELVVRGIGSQYASPVDVAPLGGLTKLEKLYLLDCNIHRIDALAKLTELRELGLQLNRIEDLGPLASLTNLEELRLGANAVTDLSPVGNLLKLRLLFVEDNRIDDIRALRDLKELQWLSLSHNKVRDLTLLAGLKNLRSLDLRDNRIDELSALTGLPMIGAAGRYAAEDRVLNLDFLGTQYRRTSNGGIGHYIHHLAGNGIDLAGNEIRDIAPLVANEDLKSGPRRHPFVDLSDNPLNADAHEVLIPQLLERGVKVRFTPKSETTPKQ